MIYFSTSKASTPVSIKRATLEGLAPDGGLYVPSDIPTFSPDELALLDGAAFSDIALAIANKFIGGEIPPDILQDLVASCYDFPTPIVSLDDSTFVEELFHGPTLAFKDYGARTAKPAPTAAPNTAPLSTHGAGYRRVRRMTIINFAGSSINGAAMAPMALKPAGSIEYRTTL